MKLLALLSAGALATGMIAATPAAARYHGHGGYHRGHGYHGGYGHGYYGRGAGWRGGYRHHWLGCRIHRGYYVERRCY